MLENYQIPENDEVLKYLKKALNSVRVDYMIQNYGNIATGIKKTRKNFCC